MGLNNPGGIKGAVKTYPCNLINGDFETGDFTGWSKYEATILSSGTYEGTHCARLRVTWTAVQCWLKQNMDCNPAGYTLTFHYYLESRYMYVRMRLSTSNEGVLVDREYSSYYSGWNVWRTDTYTIPSTVSPGILYLKFSGRKEQYCPGNYIRIDGVTLTK
jgi:hypothetical protein